MVETTLLATQVAPVSQYGSGDGLYPPSSVTSRVPDATAVEGFERLLSEALPQHLPEEQLVGAFLQRQQEFNQQVAELNGSLEQRIGNPGKMLTSQLELMRSFLLVDFSAKVAGSLSQSVNRLVNIQ